MKQIRITKKRTEKKERSRITQRHSGREKLIFVSYNFVRKTDDPVAIVVGIGPVIKLWLISLIGNKCIKNEFQEKNFFIFFSFSFSLRSFSVSFFFFLFFLFSLFERTTLLMKLYLPLQSINVVRTF